jgi:protein-disulfide isomerase
MIRNILIVAAIGAVMFCAPAFSSPAELPSSSDVVAVEVNGVKITLRDIESKRPAAMFQARNNYYEAARKTVEEYVDEVLLQQQAASEKVTVAQLLENHVNKTIAKDPSEETIRVYYETAETAEPYESLRVKILDAIRQQRIAKAKAAYLRFLKGQAVIAMRLAPPRAPITAQDTPARGPADAKVVVTEFADYECPYCQQIQPTVQKLETEFAGKIAFRYKDFPLPMHANAQKAAEASRCAQSQGKYWEYHDVVSSAKKLDIDGLKGISRQLKLDTTAFDKCLDSGEKAEVVKAQAAEAQALGLQGTPTFFINGRYVSGAISYDRLRAVILEELASSEQRPGSGTPARAGRD